MAPRTGHGGSRRAHLRRLPHHLGDAGGPARAPLVRPQPLPALRGGPPVCHAGLACGPADDEPPVDPWAGALARVRAQLDRARQWQAWIDEDPERCAADLARRQKLSRARVSQVLKLLTLDATILADLDRRRPRGAGAK